MDLFESMLQDVNNALYSYILIVLLVGVGLFFTIKTRFIQIRLIPEMFRVVSEKATIDSTGKKGVSSFQAFTISAASRIGTGNIAGVATAIALGGPGAIFWMWMIAIIGGASSLIESTLAQVYKVKDGRMYRGGPAYYMEKGLNKRWMGILFAVVISLTYGFVFNAVQANTITIAFEESFGSSRVVVGVILSIITAVIVFGGLKRIVSVTQILVPVMAIAYIAVALLVVFLNISELPNVFILIFKSAFGFEEAFAGMVGAAIMNGIKRGLFSNEAGMGSAPNAAATASVTHPVKQGLIQTLGVFIDTIIVCTSTAAIVLMSDAYLHSEAASVNLTQVSLVDNLGGWAGTFLAIAIFMFAFSSVIGNYYYGETNIGFIKESKTMLLIFRVLVVAFVMFGSVAKVQLVWDLADLFMAVMAIINLLAILMLWKIAKRVINDYVSQRKKGLDPVFYKKNVPDIGEVECWGDEDKDR
ncbi:MULTISPECIES: alanine/glycine:cation symporter family protein [unclassified Psychrobacillus]|uniref:alanine/glycine:cation symporter family protein n=1 Tax=unclassified Psychrobacillus TaxID=2636677 RepID=UPI00146A54F6|nr:MULTISPECIES: alanine/glycine:cation symporter family protein [unclassified Psychrobacillus]MCM3359935.1 alanine:cation symporter family protein [Psychrobacillus sp. MER TA 171]NME07064.1 alanine:cation symporter family protein [Psychrobacillus sp. BL-248-WT-3]